MPMQPLPADWVERIFSRLQVRYGAGWTRMWEGVDPQAVIADWAEELAPLAANPFALRYGLDNLPPDRPPTVAQFRALCNNRPDATPALPAPAANPDVVKAALSAFRPAMLGNRDWANALRMREVAGARLTLFQRKAWREALKDAA